MTNTLESKKVISRTTGGFMKTNHETKSYTTDNDKETEKDNRKQQYFSKKYKEWIEPKREVIEIANEAKEKIGYGDISLKDFVELKPDSWKDQSAVISFVAVQDKVKLALEFESLLVGDDKLLKDVSKRKDLSSVTRAVTRVIYMRQLRDPVAADKLEEKLSAYVKTKTIKELIKKATLDLQEKQTISLSLTVVEELNKKHAAIHTDRFYILTEKLDLVFGGTNFTLESKQSFKDAYENQVVELSPGSKLSKATIWLKSKDRRTYQGIIFQPNPAKVDPTYYNLWKGFSLKPQKGSCEKYRSFIQEVICNGNARYYDWLWKWCARLIQKPHLIGEMVPVLMGEQGTGKDTFVHPLGKILGGHYMPLDNIHQLLGQFNFHLKNAVLIHGNEALWGGNRKDVGKLKATVTEKLKVIEGKGKDSIVVPNFTHLILSSNEDWPVHLDRDDRRFFVLKVSSKYKEDKPYFKAIYDEFENGGLEALLYAWWNEDISDFDPRDIPHNIEAFEIKLLSANSCERYIFETLKSECFDIGNTKPSESWPTTKLKNSIVVDYQAWCFKEGVKQIDSGCLGKAIAKLMPSTHSKRPRSHDATNTRLQTYDFSKLTTAREEFQKAFKADSSIWT